MPFQWSVVRQTRHETVAEFRHTSYCAGLRGNYLQIGRETFECDGMRVAAFRPCRPLGRTTWGTELWLGGKHLDGWASRHWWKAYNKPESMPKEDRKPSAKASAIPGAQMRGTRGTHRLGELTFLPGTRATRPTTGLWNLQWL